MSNPTKKMTTIDVNITEIKPYKKNNKKHPETQVKNIAESIKQFGFVQPLVLDKSKGNEIIIGHGRYLASKLLGLKEVPCVFVDNLTEEEIKKLRLLDNKLNESEWDFEFLSEEIADLDFSGFELDWAIEELEPEIDELELKKREFEERMASGELSEDSEEYQDFLEKFKAKKTTDDCYTPPIVYDAVADYVAEHYGIEKKNFVRPFVPQGDYQAEKYKKTDIVVDNPPFSILAEIIRFYNDNGIKFFLFAPHLTLFSSSSSSSSSCLICGVGITYENGAQISTSFVTNLEQCAFRSCPKLYSMVFNANKKNLKLLKKELPKYSYPINVITTPMIGSYSRLGIDFEVSKEECYRISMLDEQKKSGKGLFGSGYLISDKKKAEREKAEREKAEREKAEREKAEREKAEREKALVWKLSARELEIIKKLK